MDNYKKKRKYLLKYFSTVDDFYGVILNKDKISMKNYKIISCDLQVGHDGYDNFGPESNLYDLKIVCLDNKTKKIYIDEWHTEEWFHPGLPEKFELYKRTEKKSSDEVCIYSIYDNNI
tara:strand:- start:255 stop:608 length:354 start_codon:yes stop_codon:yes gene_type:complete